MAEIFDNTKNFKIIVINNIEAAKLNFGIVPGACICMNCNNFIFDKLYYIAVLNDLMCENCFNEWYENAIHYEEDINYENKYFNYYTKQLDLM